MTAPSTIVPLPQPPASESLQACEKAVALCTVRLAAVGSEYDRERTDKRWFKWTFFSVLHATAFVLGVVLVATFWPIDMRNTTTWTLMCAAQMPRSQFITESKCSDLDQAFVLYVPTNDASQPFQPWSLCSAGCYESSGKFSLDECSSVSGGSAAWVYKDSLRRFQASHEYYFNCGTVDPWGVFVLGCCMKTLFFWLAALSIGQARKLQRWLRRYDRSCQSIFRHGKSRCNARGCPRADFSN